MKTTVACLGALLVAFACCGAAHAGHLSFFKFHKHESESNAFGPAFDSNGGSGLTYGLNYPPPLPPMPFNGVASCGAGAGAGAGANARFYQFMRGPRDYFMTFDPR